MEMRKRKPKVTWANEIYEYPSFFRKRQESKGRSRRNGRKDEMVEVGEDADAAHAEADKREDGKVGEFPQIVTCAKLTMDEIGQEMKDSLGVVHYEKNGLRRRDKRGKNLGDYHSGIPTRGEKDKNIYDDGVDIDNDERKLSEASNDDQNHYTDDSLFDLSSPNEEYEQNAPNTERNYKCRKKKKKMNHAVNHLVAKGKCEKVIRKKLKNTLTDRFKSFVDKGHSLHYDVDLFHYLSCLSEKKRDVLNWQGDESAHALINFIIDELIKKTNKKSYRKEHPPVQTNKQCSNNSGVAIKGYHDEKHINVKEKISFEQIKNYDETNLKHIFFMQNINIDYNGRKVEVSPFKSTIIEETAVTNGNGKVSIIKSKKYKTKKKFNLGEYAKNKNTSACTQMEKLKVCVHRDVDNLLNSHIYLNDHYFSLNSEGIQFLYFLLLCDCLFDELYGNGSQEEQVGGGREEKSDECTGKSYSQRGKQIHVDGALEKSDVDDPPHGYFNLKKIISNMETEMVKMRQEQNIFLSLCAPVIYLDFSSGVNFVDYLKEELDASLSKGVTTCAKDKALIPSHHNSEVSTRGRKKAQKEHDQEDPFEHERKDFPLNHQMNDLLKVCAEFFQGNFLAVSTCSYLNSYMFLSSEKRTRNFIFIFFVSPFCSKPLLFDMVEVNHICKKVEWVKLLGGKDDHMDSGRNGHVDKGDIANEEQKRHLDLLLCLVGDEISIYAIPKRHLFQKLYDATKNEPTSVEPTEYIKQKISDRKFEKVFSYNDEEELTDFSYSICVNDNQRFLKIALTFNSTRIKVLCVYLREISRFAKITRFIEREETTNACVHTCADYLLSHFKNPLSFSPFSTLVPSPRGEISTGEKVPLSLESLQTNELAQSAKDTHCVAFHEDILHLQQGIISVCSFYPCLNSYLLCVSSKEGEIIIIDIRNNSELYFFKRKTESVTHMRWYENSCLSFGQEKGCIIHLFENKYFLNIDKDWTSQLDIICIHSSLLNDMHLFLFDDGTVLRGKLKGRLSKVKISELFLWKTPNFHLDPEVLLSISAEKEDETESVSRILFYEYLQGLQNILRNGVKIGKSKAVEENARDKTIALTPRCVSIASLGQKYLIAYGNGSGLVHIFSREKDLDRKSLG
ncbi:conserved Plasmodium protein, unknown function [Plasmodium knowlesi strain H]|uniref:Uncharacterized protein n=3 Tax=Plasmodium knowlesi TaxID=5850 RepID=A0A5K1V4D6_PLAKH|nr:conserved Plasmodium protein, unknown function [Plasmodium knowlesi strain H]OTN67126.1 Uncharacterized protein PKNOH_S07446700 [Plasmodium knowlesi]CAA9988594.1 conserved Plasmodium protein, unknown function [Plasmodium knowlesi strain H]SBO21417.1 conserved Plasmodium protein, unknown function [Plasmodium knowlesi strain H]SBO21868.1 conserved Plasmodium protein, unknown function [Plasmodium knowlesi strain H]VVS78068.1 conserved Plasmodium protein, unknown function [Plasmodium knowlesi s|eukprot:XP_002259570.1 hypothetical protein, conserved in Plasmodium species [Plasmodium knowlesi strain H]